MCPRSSLCDLAVGVTTALLAIGTVVAALAYRSVQQYSSIAVQQYSSTAVQQYSSTEVQQYSSTEVQQHIIIAV